MPETGFEPADYSTKWQPPTIQQSPGALSLGGWVREREVQNPEKILPPEADQNCGNIFLFKFHMYLMFYMYVIVYFKIFSQLSGNIP